MLKNLPVKIASLFVVVAVLFGISSCSDSGTNTTAKSSEKKILSFKFEGLSPVVVANIDESAKVINIGVAADVNKSALVPTITVSDNATISPASGVAQNFDSTVIYTVTAQDGSTTQYYVTVGINLPETISESKVFKNINTGSDYFINGNLTIAAGAVVTFQAGCVVQFNSPDGKITVENGGALKTTGTADRTVAFIGSGHAKGTWNQILINSNRLENKWEYANIINGGKNKDDGAVVLGPDAALNMSNCSINGSLGHGLYLQSSSSLKGFKNNSIKACEQSPVYALDIDQIRQLDSTSSLSGNKEDFVVVERPSLIMDDELTIEKLNVPYHFSSIRMDNSVLTVKPGAVLMFSPGSKVQIFNGGTLIAEGTATDKVTFTATDKTPGSWSGISIETQKPNSMKNCVVEYAGKDNGANLDISSGSLNILNCLLQNSNKYGAIVSGATKVTGSGVTFNNCPGGNVYHTDTKAVSTTLP